MLRRFARFGLLEAFVAIITALFLVLTLLDYLHARDSARSEANAVLLQSEHTVAVEVQRLNGVVRILLAQLDAGCSKGTVDFRRPETVHSLVMPVLQETAPLTSVVRGDHLGNNYLLLRTPSGWKNRLRTAERPTTDTWVTLDARGKETERHELKENFDYRQRPWYREAPPGGEINWSSPYIFRSTGELGVTASKRLSGGAGVAGVDITLKDLSSFLAGTTSHLPGTTVLITDSRGRIVASSEAADFMKRITSRSARLPSLADPHFALEQEAARNFERDGNAFQERQSARGLVFTRVSAIQLTPTNRVRIVLTVPRSVFTRDFIQALWWKIALYLAVLLTASVLYLRRYILPLRELVHLIGESDFSRPRLFPVLQRGDEVGMLYSHINDMTGKLIEGMAALSHSEEHYRLLVEHSNSIIVRWKSCGSITYINSFGARFFGYLPHELVGRSISAMFPAGDAGEIARLLTEHCSPHRGTLSENVTRDGRTVWINWSNAAMDERCPADAEILSVGNDVTVWKEAELRLGEREEAYRLLAENMQDVIWRTTREYVFTYISPSDQRLRGFPSAAMLGQPVWDTLAPGSRQEFLKLVQRQRETLARGKRLGPELLQAEQITCAGTVWVEIVCTPLYDGDLLTGFQGMTRDITERREAEEEVRNARDYLSSVLNTIGDPIIVKDDNGRLVLLNDSGCSLFGDSLAQIAGKSDYDFFPAEQADVFRRIDRFVLETGESNINEEVITDAKGEIRSIVTRKTRYVDPAGRRYVVAAVRDITELREAQSKVVEGARQAGMAEIAVNVLHNVGNVLNSVCVSAGEAMKQLRGSRVPRLGDAVRLMEEQGAELGSWLSTDPKGRLLPGYLGKLAAALCEEQRRLTEEVMRLRGNIEHISDIIATQQRYAGASGVVQPAQVRDLLEDALQMNGELLLRHSVKVTKEFVAVPEMPLDKARVLLIVVNLISNAIHAMAASGDRAHELTLRLERSGEGAQEEAVRILVTDNGEGIPAKNLTRIFVHGFTTRKGGHGFGLHSCALAAGEMGGTLTAHSDGAGKGATFVLEIPVAAAS